MTDVLCIRGDGTHPAGDILEPLLASDAAAVARGTRELDAGALHAEVSITCKFTPGAANGQIVEVSEGREPAWRGMIAAVSHNAEGPLATTTLQVIRAL